MTDFNSLIAEFGRQVQENLRIGEGEPEAQLTNPVATLLQDFGALHSMKVVTVRETSLKTAGGGLVSEGLVRPDYAIMVDGVLTGYVELKAPGKNIDPASFTKKSHEYKQWQRLRNLPNLLYTNGTEWRLYRYGEPVLTSTGYDAVHMHGSFSGHGTLSAPDALAAFFLNFLRWAPSPITSADQLVETLAPLAALLREEMLLGLAVQEKTYKADQAKAKKKGEEDFVIPPPLVGLRKDWRDTLAPSTSNEEFADSFAQTVVFSLVVALSEGHDLSLETFSTMAGRLRSQHGLLGNALGLLTEHLDEKSSLYNALAVIVRVIGAASWVDISGGKSDVYLHLYEHFLKVYNPEQRKKTGSYYTPVEVVDQMVRLVDDALRTYLGKEHGLASEGVSVIDPAMGTGTYPLSVMHKVASAESLPPAARTRALNRLAKNAVFAIETPVSIALFLREENTDEETPADIRYVALHGTFAEKMQALAALELDSAEFDPVRSGWGDKFAPEAGGDWDSYPELPDFYASCFPGVKPNKTWVYAPSESVLQERWAELIEGNDLEVRAERFKETRDTKITEGKKPLPGNDTFLGSLESLNDQIARELIPDTPNIVQVGYRSFDRQYILADARLLHMPSPKLWEHRVSEQIFIVEQHAHYPKAGPGLHFSALIPDMDAFKGSEGGRAHPVLNINGTPNLTEPAAQMLRERFGDNAPGNLVYYLAALTGHPGYVRTFDEPLQQAGIRVPLTADPALWERAVRLGKQVVWLHTYGERGEPLPGMKYLHQLPEGADYTLPNPTVDMGKTMPEKKPSFSPDSVIGSLSEEENIPITGTVSFGRARCENVEKRVFDYTVGGNQVLGLWAKYRLKKPVVRRSSSLNDIVQREWSDAWSEEYERLLYTLTHLVHLEPTQEKLLGEVLAGEQIFREEFVDTED